MLKNFAAVAAVSSMLVWSPAAAEDGISQAPAATGDSSTNGPEQASSQPAAPACELHVWPTHNYIGINTGLLSGFGIVGSLADGAAHKNRVQTVKDLMRDYLGPEVQMAELDRTGLLQSLKLPANYRIVIEEPTPFGEDIKKDPALKARTEEMNKTLKANRRLSASQSPCYAELITTMIFYHKAMMYGSNLFTGWIYRDFGDRPLAQKVAQGAVKNPLEVFPPKTPEQVDQAKAELRDAYAKDYDEWLAKKFSAAAAPRAARR